MSLGIWPNLQPRELKVALEATQTIHLRLRTLPPQTIVVDPTNPIIIEPLDTLNTLLVRSIDLLDLTLSHAFPAPVPAPENANTPGIHDNTTTFLAAQLRVLAQAFHDASTLLKGPPLSKSDPSWTTRSASLLHFSPPLSPALSFYIGLQDSQLVVCLRALEPAGVPVNLGMKFALALGTARRLEHEEADRVFTYCCEDGLAKGLHVYAPPGPSSDRAGDAEGPADVYVREKIRVETADPSLLSLSAKLNALSHTLVSARKNLAAAMDEDLED